MKSFTSENNILFTSSPSGQGFMFTNIKDVELHILALEAYWIQSQDGKVISNVYHTLNTCFFFKLLIIHLLILHYHYFRIEPTCTRCMFNFWFECQLRESPIKKAGTASENLSNIPECSLPLVSHDGTDLTSVPVPLSSTRNTRVTNGHLDISH